MRGRTDATDSRRDDQAVQRRPSDEKVFEAPVHRPDAVGLGDPAVINLEVNLQIALYPIQRYDFIDFHDDVFGLMV